MKFISLLDEQQCAALKGGLYGITNISMTSFASSLVGLGQTNSATNVGLGLLVGAGNAQSIQGNTAFVNSFVF
jgi:hypothetical protein